MIKLIIFDLSDVCFNNEEIPFVERVAERNGLDKNFLLKEYELLMAKAEIDEISGIALWKELIEKFNLHENPESAMREMFEEKVLYEENLNFIKSLRGKVQTAYLTNYNGDYWKLTESKIDMDEWFDYGLVSYQIKSRKPSDKGFKMLMEYFNVTPEEVVFTDDKASNLVPAKEIGINVVEFKNLEDFKSKLQELGVELYD